MDENRDIKKSFVRAPILYWFLIAVLLLLAPKPKVGRRNANDLASFGDWPKSIIIHCRQYHLTGGRRRRPLARKKTSKVARAQ